MSGAALSAKPKRSRQQLSTTPAHERDEWRTPPFVFHYMHRRLRFGVDLAATPGNALCDRWLTGGDDALSLAWVALGVSSGWCNPPYSRGRIKAFLRHAIDEARHGFTTCFLVPACNGADYWRELVPGVASEVIEILGRLTYLKPDGTPASTPQFGSSLVIYRGFDLGDTRHRFIERDAMRDPGA